MPVSVLRGGDGPRGRAAMIARAPYAVLASALLVLTCCAPGDGEPGRSTEGASESLALPESRDEVRGSSEELLAWLTEDDGALGNRGGRVRFGNGAWEPCTDDEAGWAYDTDSRIDLDEAGAGLEAFEDLRLTLDAVGWIVDDRSAVDPEDTLTARKGELLLRVSSGEQDFVLVSVGGPCLPVSEEERQRLSSTGPEPLEL